MACFISLGHKAEVTVNIVSPLLEAAAVVVGFHLVYFKYYVLVIVCFVCMKLTHVIASVIKR